MAEISEAYAQIRMAKEQVLDNDMMQYDDLRLKRMYHYPADYEEASLHYEANKFGYNRKKKTDKDSRPPPLCPCCEVPINVKEIRLCESTQPHIRT